MQDFGDVNIKRVTSVVDPDKPVSGGAPPTSALKGLDSAVEAQPHVPSFYGSPYARHVVDRDAIPKHGMPARYCERMIQDYHLLDYNERLNTSSYINVVFEPEEERVAVMGMKINLADQTVYPSSFQLHNEVVNMLGNLWNVPQPEEGPVAGAGTVGSTEAVLLAGLALKFRWRDWYKKKHGLTDHEVRGVYPNLVMSSAYQACWGTLMQIGSVLLLCFSMYYACFLLSSIGGLVLAAGHCPWLGAGGGLPEYTMGVRVLTQTGQETLDSRRRR